MLNGEHRQVLQVLQAVERLDRAVRQKQRSQSTLVAEMHYLERFTIRHTAVVHLRKLEIRKHTRILNRAVVHVHGRQAVVAALQVI